MKPARLYYLKMYHPADGNIERYVVAASIQHAIDAAIPAGYELLEARVENGTVWVVV